MFVTGGLLQCCWTRPIRNVSSAFLEVFPHTALLKKKKKKSKVSTVFWVTLLLSSNFLLLPSPAVLPLLALPPQSLTMLCVATNSPANEHLFETPLLAVWLWERTTWLCQILSQFYTSQRTTSECFPERMHRAEAEDILDS